MEGRSLTHSPQSPMRENGKLLLVTTFLMVLTISSPSIASWDGIIIGQADYQGLQAFKHSLSDPRGVLRSWNGTGVGACSGAWAGIKCARGQVIAIQLPWRGLGGTLTESVGQLAALRKLSLHDNAIGGQVPSAFGFLPSLRGLYLFNNRLSGAIPPSLGRCLSLQALDFSNNFLTGSIPSSITDSTRRLYRLNLSYNNLSGGIPDSIARSPAIAFLSLAHNNLSGTIPGSLGRLSMLRTLDLSGNSITGSVPESLDGLRNLSVLSLNDNLLGGGIPASIGNLSRLSRLDLSDNELRGEVPASLVRLSNLTFFNVSNNNLSGPVPPLLSRRFNSSSFRGNILLCGFSPSAPCPSPPPSPSPNLPPSPIRRRRGLGTRDIILIAAGITLALLLLLCCVLLCCVVRKRTAAGKQQTKAAGGGGGGGTVGRGEKPGTAVGEAAVESGGDAGGKLVHFDGPFLFTADDLLCATAEIMGKSTYGTVYKATLEDGNQVAVKRLREKIAKGQREFETEVNALGKIRHPNLLALRAYYLGPKGEKLLVFDYMPKGSLAAFLHARGPDTPIDWPTRMNIAMGTARGLHYLHNDMNMIHGNLTSANVLLDDTTNARISDYGLSRLMTAAANSNVIATAGALGYRAPELSKLKKASTKTDVYSLGVIVLELLTGKSPGESMSGVDLPQWVASIVKEEWTNEVFDLELMRDAAGTTGDELLNTLKLALHCVDPSPAARPEVQQVLLQLEEIKPELAGGGAAAASTSEEATAAAAGPSTATE
ncbi:putative leucine-rich repeat receptor-like protein kinase IMK3 [Iris pallida]|uniref:Leucine-rich repeat receptor-like protein kinase IMK3 n=1 Tax=Iris pallida TaxID=29817 RepID=A0AAX6EQT6_IRIPA|nr:putative leucine-rich repeat receptor-like protein kinase IMK3 [Iris pallida]